MTKLSCCLLALAAAQSCHAFVVPGNARTSDIRLDAKLEGRDIDGVLTPTNNFVLVKVADIQSETEGGIFLTGSVSMRMFYACLPELVMSNIMRLKCAQNMISHISYQQSIEYLCITISIS